MNISEENINSYFMIDIVLYSINSIITKEINLNILIYIIYIII